MTAMLNAAARRGLQTWTNRVVQEDGAIAPQADASYGQRAQLIAEGVPFDSQGCVDLLRCPPIVLHK